VSLAKKLRRERRNKEWKKTEENKGKQKEGNEGRDEKSTN
jgi:hypothetical protein